MKLVENSVSPLSAQSDKLLSGLFAEMGTLNQNGRIYPEDIYESAYEKLIPKINERRLLGELDHPIDYDEIRLANVSHVITECRVVRENGVKKVYGTVELLDTPAGKVAQSLVSAGIPLGISSRGLGATKPVREGDEVTQLNLLTYDLVAEPSFSTAILSPDKRNQLSDSLHYIESTLPLNESVETNSVRDMIHSIRESLIEKKTDLDDKVDIKEKEINELKGLLESSQETIKSDTQIMMNSRKEIKYLKAKLKESKFELENLMNNMLSLQEAYNELKKNSISKEKLDEVTEELIESRKLLAVEKRGMAYNQVSELLEGATTSEDIENRLNSLSSFGRKRQTSLVIKENTLTESKSINKTKKPGLASIVAKV